MYFYVNAVREAVRAAIAVLVGARVIYNELDAVPVSALPDIDTVIGEMGAEELCIALNKAMYRHPHDPDMLYPEWFVELAREGVYLTGVLALNDHIGGECVVRVNGTTIHFDQEVGGWTPYQHAA